MNHLTLDEFTFRPLGEADLPLLQEWIRRPHVARWWGEGKLPDSSVKGYIALLSGEPIGFIQSYVAMDCGDGWWEDETDPGVRGIDQFLGDGDKLGQGIGRRMVAAFVRRLFEDPGVTMVQTDPHPMNVRAIRCYEGAGFQSVGEIVTPDGPAVLMVLKKP